MPLSPTYVPRGTSRTNQTNLREVSDALPEAWRSKIVGRTASASVKVLRMDGTAPDEEPHAYAEGLLVLDGELKLEIGGSIVAVAAGSHGTLAIIDQDE